MTNEQTLDEAKRDLRARMSGVRSSISRDQRERAALALAKDGLEFADLDTPQVISAYAAIGEELDSLPLLERLDSQGHRFALPVVPGKAVPLIFRSWKPGGKLVKAGFGLRVPPESSSEVIPDVLLVPLLAFDERGYRLGYGGGYYDRTLQKLRSERSVTAIGLAFDEQRVEKVPRDHYDQQLDWVLTPSGAHRTGK